MLVDLCHIQTLRQGDRLYRQNTRVHNIYFVMHGEISLTYNSKMDFTEHLSRGGYLGMTLGEELLFYKRHTYRETAVCLTRDACCLVISAPLLLRLGDDDFVSHGMAAEMHREDMD